MGTCNLLDAVRLRAKPCTVVVVTSDKCYENVATSRAYLEDDAMGGHDPYSASKGAVELLTASYRRSYFSPEKLPEHGIKVATVRAGNVIGGGDWARDRIVPDIVSHLTSGRPVPLRNPAAVRPWQHVLAPLHGYLFLASRMLTSDDAALCGAWNFGPNNAGTCCVSDLVDRFCAAWGGGSWKYIGTESQPHEAQLLKLSISKALQLGWNVVWSLDQTVERTAQWYRAFHGAGGSSMLDACLADIRDYSQELAAANSLGARERLTAA
jgi:CDP-glucose 4,6-dehydratase